MWLSLTLVTIDLSTPFASKMRNSPQPSPRKRADTADTARELQIIMHISFCCWDAAVTDTKLHLGLTSVMRPLAPKQPTGWRKVTLTNVSEVEELLDRLEQEACELRVTLTEDKFIVRWRTATD